MTATGRWLASWSGRLRSKQVLAVMVMVLGLVLASFGLGLFLGRIGLYLMVPASVFFGWLVAGAAVAWGIVWLRRWLRMSKPAALARTVR